MFVVKEKKKRKFNSDREGYTNQTHYKKRKKSVAGVDVTNSPVRFLFFPTQHKQKDITQNPAQTTQNKKNFLNRQTLQN